MRTTHTSGQWDVNRVAKAVASPGIDTRLYLAEAIVAVPGDDGEIDDTDPNAVLVAPEGREVDVILLPGRHTLTCRVPSGGPNSTEDWPIRPGDHVLVGVPEGEGANGGVVIAVLNSAADQLPTEGGQAMFDDQRRLIWCSQPVDIRAGSGDGRVTVTPEGQVLLGGPAASQAVPLGNTMVSDLDAAMFADLTNSLLQAFTLLKVIAVGPFAVFQPGFNAGFQAMTKLAEHANWLSGVTKTK